MIRLIAILVGLGFVAVSTISFGYGFVAWVGGEQEETSEYLKYHEHPHSHAFSFDGPFGKWGRQQLQRGFQVYKEVCAGCHGLSYVAFRNLQDIGYSEAEVRAIADQWAIQVPTLNPDTGKSYGPEFPITTIRDDVRYSRPFRPKTLVFVV